MKNEVLNKIKEFARNELQKHYGFVGCADGEDVAMLNSSDNEGNDFVITIKSKPE